MESQFDNIKAEILSVYHNIRTEIPGHGKVIGVFVIAKTDDDLIFYWREYPEVKSSFTTNKNENPKLSLILQTKNIEKIMVNYHSGEPFVLINAIESSNTMYQFNFDPGSSYQLINFIQIVSLSQQTEEQKSLSSTVNFLAESFSVTENHFGLYEFSIENNKWTIPIDFSMNGLPPTVDFVKPELHIMTQFQIKADDYTQNPITEAELESFSTNEELKTAVMNRGVDPSARHRIWPIIFNVLPLDQSKQPEVLKSRISEYLTIRKQWQLKTRGQFKYDTLIREAFTTIRDDVQRTHAPKVLIENFENDYSSSDQDISDLNNNSNAQKLQQSWCVSLLNILRTYTLLNLDVRYTQGLNDLAVNFMAAFSPIYKRSKEEMEALTFWCFASFSELIESGLIADNLMVMQSRELGEIMKIIENFHPACAKWLNLNNVGNLSFLISSFILAYGRSFSPESVLRIWETLGCVPKPWLFLRYFSASLIILSFPSFQKIPNCSIGKLVSAMDRIFYHQEIGAVIGVSLKMMMNITNEKQLRGLDTNRTKSRKEIDSNIVFKSREEVLFEPNKQFENSYQIEQSLFY